MDVTALLRTEASIDALRSVVADLGTYPEWLDIVERADALEPGVWRVDLRGQIGPLRRTKRLRMTRTVDDELLVRFDRAEVDGREHSPWVLEARVAVVDDGSELEMRLHYGGGLWVPMVERLLRDEIERSKPRLAAALARR